METEEEKMQEEETSIKLKQSLLVEEHTPEAGTDVARVRSETSNPMKSLKQPSSQWETDFGHKLNPSGSNGKKNWGGIHPRAIRKNRNLNGKRDVPE